MSVALPHTIGPDISRLKYQHDWPARANHLQELQKIWRCLKGQRFAGIINHCNPLEGNDPMAFHQMGDRRIVRRSPARRPQNAEDISGKRVRSDPTASIAHFTALAQSAAAAGDQVQAETYHQQAEFYRKLLRGNQD